MYSIEYHVHHRSLLWNMEYELNFTETSGQRHPDVDMLRAEELVKQEKK